MTIYKNKDIETNINERGVDLGNINVTLYTKDNGTASLRIFLKRETTYENEKVIEPVDLTKTNMTPKLLMIAQDGSIFYESVEIIKPETGVIQYNVSDAVLRHIGKVETSVLLIGEDNTNSHVANFYFYVADSGLSGSIGREVDTELLEDIVADVMAKNAMGVIGEDFKDQLYQEVKDYVKLNVKDFQLHYEDLTYEQRQQLVRELADQTVADIQFKDNSIAGAKLVDKTITSSKLADQYSAVKILNEDENITTIYKEGIYFKTPTTRLKGLPTQLADNGYGYSGILIIKPYSMYHYVQTLYDLENKGVFYNRVVKNNANTEWKAYSDDVTLTQVANDKANTKIQNVLNVFEKYSNGNIPEDVIKGASAIQDLHIEGVDPNIPIKIWILARNFSTWNYRMILGQKVNGKWSTLLDTGANFTVTEAENGATNVEYEKNGIKLKARINYNLIPNGDRFLDNRTMDDNPYLVIRPSKIGTVATGTGGGVEAYDQKLNTTNDVNFNTVSTNSLNTKSLYIDSSFPTGTKTSPPDNLKSGDLWLDTTDSSTHPIVRVMK